MRIEKNYRNTIQINNLMENYINISKDYIKDFNISLENEEESFLLGTAFRDNCEPNIIITDRMSCIDEIIKEIKYLKEDKKVPLNRIAVIFPYRQYRPLTYYFMTWLENKLKEEFIDYFPLITSPDGGLPVHYGNNKGVALTTIEASLGLDFDAVILSGLLPMGTYHKSKYVNHIVNRNENNEDIEQDFVENVNKIYTACTRARDYLTIILEEDESTSLYSKMILESATGGLNYGQGL
jgi:superfamily I DNA/RNA helicase